MKITLLADQQPHDFLQGEFGLSLLLEHNQTTFLFDTGAGSALKNNLKLLNISEENVQKIILSHGHYDHTGGLAELNPEVIYCCENIAEPQYSFHSADDIHDISIPPAAQKILQQCSKVWIKDFTLIAPDIYLTGPIPRRSNEDCGGKFFRDPACTVPCTVPEEQALLTADGVLVSGCCHAGIINTVMHCQEAAGITPHTVIGGLHLRHASPARLQETAGFIRKNNIRNLCLLHCTGGNAVDFLRNALPECTVYSPGLGESLIF